MKLYKEIDEKRIGRKMLLNAVKMEESLAELLKSEAKLLRKCTMNGASNEEIQRTNKIIRYVFFTMTMVDDRIRTGLSLLHQDPEETKGHNT